MGHMDLGADYCYAGVPRYDTLTSPRELKYANVEHKNVCPRAPTRVGKKRQLESYSRSI